MEIAQEFERKFQVSLVKAELEELLDITFEGAVNQVDVYYDTPNADLFIKGIFLRVRDGKFFQIKVNFDDLASGKSSGHVRCTEISLPLDFGAAEITALQPVLSLIGLTIGNAKSCFELFAENGLIASVSIDKTRAFSRQEWGGFYLDSVVGLGDFLEVEASVSADFISGINYVVEKLDAMIADGMIMPIDTGYNALFWRNKDYEIYLRCPYVMKKDIVPQL